MSWATRRVILASGLSAFVLSVAVAMMGVSLFGVPAKFVAGLTGAALALALHFLGPTEEEMSRWKDGKRH